MSRDVIIINDPVVTPGVSSIVSERNDSLVQTFKATAPGTIKSIEISGYITENVNIIVYSGNYTEGNSIYDGILDYTGNPEEFRGDRHILINIPLDYSPTVENGLMYAIGITGQGLLTDTVVTEDGTSTYADGKVYINDVEVAGKSLVFKLVIFDEFSPDTEPPVITSPLTDTTTSDATPTISGTGIEGLTVQVIRATQDSSVLIGSSVVDSLGKWSVTPTTNISDGLHAIYAKHSDDATYNSEASNAVFITIATAPAVPAPVITTPLNNTTTKDSTQTITGTGEAGATVTVYEGLFSLGTCTVQPDKTWSFTPTIVLSEGVHSITAKQKLTTGEVSPASSILTLTIDTVAPILSKGTAIRLSDTTATIGFSSNEPGQYFYSIVEDGEPKPPYPTGGTGLLNNAGECVITNPTGLTAGAKDIYIEMQDGAGNMSSALKIDIEAYVQPIIIPGQVSDGIASKPSIYVYNGTPYVAYVDNSNGISIKVKKFNGTAWEYVGLQSFSTNITSQVCIFVYNAVPYIAYIDLVSGARNPSKIVVKMYINGEWKNVGTGVSGLSNMQYVDIYINEGIPYIAYSDGYYSIAVKKFNGTDWVSIGQVTEPGYVSAGLSLYVYNGTPYIAYIDYAMNNKPIVKKFNGTVWEDLGYAGLSLGTPGVISLKLVNGTPYIAYVDSDNSKVTVRKYNGSTWENTGLEYTTGNRTNYSYLSEENGALYIALVDYLKDSSTGKTTVKMYNGTSWSTVGVEMFSQGAVSGSALSLFVHSGTPYAAYSDMSNGQRIMAMKFNGVVWVYIPDATEDGSVMVVDSTGTIITLECVLVKDATSEYLKVNIPTLGERFIKLVSTTDTKASPIGITTKTGYKALCTV